MRRRIGIQCQAWSPSRLGAFLRSPPKQPLLFFAEQRVYFFNEPEKLVRILFDGGQLTKLQPAFLFLTLHAPPHASPRIETTRATIL
jgi:hypothetical protein